MISTVKQQKYQYHLQVKLINMNILELKKYYHLIKYLTHSPLGNQCHLQVKLINMNILELKKYYHLIKYLTYSQLGKAFEKQKQKQLKRKEKKVEALKVLKPNL